MIRRRRFDIVVFGGYTDRRSDVPEIFQPGELIVIINVEPDGVYRCLAIRNGKVDPSTSDTVFLEEIRALGPANVAA